MNRRAPVDAVKRREGRAEEILDALEARIGKRGVHDHPIGRWPPRGERATIGVMTTDPRPVVLAALSVKQENPDLSIDEIAAAAAGASLLGCPESADVIARIAHGMRDRELDD